MAVVTNMSYSYLVRRVDQRDMRSHPPDPPRPSRPKAGRVYWIKMDERDNQCTETDKNG